MYFCNFLHSVKSDGSVVHSEVRTLLHNEHTITRTFLSITTAFNKTVALTDTHLIYVRKRSTEKFYAMLVYLHPQYIEKENIYEY